MSYYKKDKQARSYANDLIASDVGEFTKDSLSISTFYKLDIESDIVTYESEVVKNCFHDYIPITGKVIGKKYKEVLLKASYKECLEFINKYVMSEGYWTRDSKNTFKEIFIEPIESKEPELKYPQ